MSQPRPIPSFTQRFPRARRTARIAGSIGAKWAAALLVLCAAPMPFPAASPAVAQDQACTDAKIVEVEAKVRLEEALELIRGKCMTVPGPIWTVIQKGVWPDELHYAANDRVLLINTAIAAGYADAESLAVRALETGELPTGPALEPPTGAMLLEGLAPALTDYRIGLLLDIYEQVPHIEVRSAVVRTLRNANGPEALLPALDANYARRASVAEARLTFSEQPDKEPQAILIRVIETLPDGPALDWAVRLADEFELEEAQKAARARGK
jgi:hypothetical protein